MQLAPGTVFAGDYRIVRPLSAGGMGAVYLVEQLSTGKHRALKLMHRELVYDPASRQHFEQEARIGARIASEHVVEVQAAGVDAATQLPYLVMELLEGEDMATRLQRGPFTLIEAATIFEQLGHALGAAHDAGVVHRDLKPENVFLAVSKRTGMSLMVKVLDFGIAKVIEGQTRTTAAFGTPLWLAPEQTQRGVITPAADVWAMGLLAFAMLTGHVFWRAGEGPEASVTQLIREIVFDPIPPASARAAERGTTLPPGFDAWFASCVTREPRARFQNARAAYQALAPVLRGGAHVAVLPSGSTLVHGDGQYAPTQDAVPAVVDTRPSPGRPRPIATPPPQPAPLPPTTLVDRGAASQTAPPEARRRGSLGCALAGAAVTLLFVAGAAAAYMLVVRPRLDAISPAQTLDAGSAAATASTPGLTPTPTLSIPSLPSEVPDFAELLDGGLPTPIVPTTGGAGLHFGGIIQSDDPALRTDAEDKFNGPLSAKFDQCLAAHPPSAPSGMLPVVAHVKADGTVSDVEAFSMNVVGPLVPCVRDIVKATRFAAPKRATKVTFALMWTRS
ncbi:MAG TPA: serine/threonine-protein kinase [Polyangiaceae bacterium]|nr:serine/threonine-protein kinase [Polyangiaceae bacterium]